MLKIRQANLQQYVNHELPDVQACFRKDRRTRDQIANICWIIEKAREFQKNIYFCFLDYAKAFDCWITINFGKSSIQVLDLFLIKLFVFVQLFWYEVMNPLNIVDINHYHVFEIFSSILQVTILMNISFALKKLFSLILSHLLVFVFVACAVGVISKRTLPRPISICSSWI